MFIIKVKVNSEHACGVSPYFEQHKNDLREMQSAGERRKTRHTKQRRYTICEKCLKIPCLAYKLTVH